MVSERRLLVSLVGKSCGGQSFNDIIMVARANKNHEQNVMRSQFNPLIPYDMHNYYTSLYLHVTALHTVFVSVDLAAVLSTKKDKQHVCVYLDHEWKFVVFYLLARPKVKQDTLVVADGMKHVYHALCLWSSQDSARST
jgi:hypothetical protein